MIDRPPFISPLLGTAVLGCCLAAPARADELKLSANTPEITVSTRSSARIPLQLPALEYEFRVAPNCPADLRPASISLSIADTRITNDELADTGEVNLTIRIPADQLAPVRIDNFCVAQPEGASHREELRRIPSILSAQAAVLCASDLAQEMSYASASLDVRVRCEAPPAAQSIELD